MALYLTEAEVDSLLTMEDALEAVEGSFRRLAAGERDDAWRTGYGVDRHWVERVHTVVHFVPRKFSLPAKTVVQRQPAQRPPVILRVESGVGGTRLNQV